MGDRLTPPTDWRPALQGSRRHYLKDEYQKELIVLNEAPASLKIFIKIILFKCYAIYTKKSLYFLNAPLREYTRTHELSEWFSVVAQSWEILL